MSLVTALLAPLALLLPAAGALEPMSNGSEQSPATAMRADDRPSRLALPVESMLPALDPADTVIFQTIAQSFQVEAQNQVRIEQRMTIRITPFASAPQPNMLLELPAARCRSGWSSAILAIACRLPESPGLRSAIPTG